MKRLWSIFILFCMASNAIAQQNVPNGATAPAVGQTVNDNFPGTYPSGVRLNSQKVILLKTPIDYESGISSLPYNATNVFVSYGDGFERPIQTVLKQGGTQFKDVVTLTFYDSTGRQPISPLPYAIDGANAAFRLNAFNEQKQYFNSSPSWLAAGDGAFAYSKTKFDDQSLERNVSTFSPGLSKVGQANITSVSSVRLSDAGEYVIKWDFTGSSNPPNAVGYYGDGELFVNEVTNANGSRTLTYKDVDGNVILTKKTGEKSIMDFSHNGWLCTYLVYDEYNRVRQIISPKATQLLLANSLNISATSLANLCNSYDYDNRGRIISKKLPGKAIERIIYDNSDRPVLVQDGNFGGAGNRWIFTKYDVLGRIIMTGWFLNNNFLSETTLRAQMASGSPSNPFLQFLTSPVTSNVYNTGSVLYQAEILTLNYYDNYENVPSISPYDTVLENGVSNIANGDASERSDETLGLITGSSIRIMDGVNLTSSWEHVVRYYDKKGRQIQSQSRNYAGGDDAIVYKYDFVGHIVASKSSQFNPLALSTDLRTVIIQKLFVYDFQGRISTIYQKTNDEQTWRKIGTSSYNVSGDKLLTRVLGNSAETQNYKYRIWGDLESINKEFCTGADTSKFFGELLSYDYGFGKLNRMFPSGMRWRMKGSSGLERAYGYEYDDAGRLKNADYSRKANILSWTNLFEDLSAKNMLYDANGNISHMEQWYNVAGVTLPIKIDNLDYNYADNGQSNQLLNVTDSNLVDYGLGEFNEPLSAHGNTNQDYSYDNNGNATKDENREITSILYDYLDKPYEINFTGSRKITFKYDASGRLLRKQIDEPGQPSKKIDFLNGLEYTDDQLTSVSHEEGRVRPVKVTLASSATAWSYEYDYYIKDHLGNVRSVVTESIDSNQWVLIGNPSTDEFSASAFRGVAWPGTKDVPIIGGNTMAWRNYLVTNEIVNAAGEEATFNNVAETRDDKVGSGNPSDLKETKLDASEGKVIGPSILLPVAAGDKMVIQAKAMYEEGENPEYHGTTPIDEFVTAIGTALSGGGGFNYINESGMSGELISSTLSSSQFLASMQELKNANQAEANKPQAFLNYIYLDEDMQVVEDQSGFVQTKQPGDWNTLEVPEYTLRRSGYLLVFLSNESNMAVHFDNLNVQHYKGKLLEENHYYPYGLTISKKAFVQAATNDNLYVGQKLNRKEFSSGKGLNWYDMNARQYDPQIGRWHTMDALSENAVNWTPYRYAFDNPVVFKDPSGLYEGDGTYGDDDESGQTDGDAYTYTTVRYENSWMGKEGEMGTADITNERGEVVHGVTGPCFEASEITIQTGGPEDKVAFDYSGYDQGMNDFSLTEEDGGGAGGTNAGGNSKKVLKWPMRAYFIFEDLTPGIYYNAVENLAKFPQHYILTYNGGGKIADKKRRHNVYGTTCDILEGFKWEREEFPPAIAKEGWRNLGTISVRCIDPKEHEVQKRALYSMVMGIGTLTSGRMKPGDRFFVIPISSRREKEPVKVRKQITDFDNPFGLPMISPAPAPYPTGTLPSLPPMWEPVLVPGF